MVRAAPVQDCHPIRRPEAPPLPRRGVPVPLVGAFRAIDFHPGRWNKMAPPKTNNSGVLEEIVMKSWTRPVIVELQVGMEINCYVCAEL